MLGDDMEPDHAGVDLEEESEGEEETYRKHQKRIAAKANLRQYLEEVRAKKTSGGINAAFVENIVNKLDTNIKDVKFAQEAAVDAQVVCELTMLAVEEAQKRTSGSVSFNMGSVIKALRNEILQEAEDNDDVHEEVFDWSVLYDSTLKKLPLKVPATHFMLGPVSFIPAKRLAAQRQQRETFDESLKAKPLTDAEAMLKAEEVTTKTVNKMQDIVSRLEDPICFFRFVVHPTDFAQTVENIFHLSFLVKQGHVAVYLNEDGLPMIEKCKPYDENVDNAEVVHRKQVVMSLTMDEWKEIIDLFEIEDSFLEWVMNQDGEAEEGGEDEEDEEEDDDDDEDDRKRARR